MISKQQLKEWKADPIKAGEDLGKVIDVYKRLVPFKLNANQRLIHERLKTHNELYILKSRQLGSTTYTLWRFFHKALLTPYFKCAIVAHTKEAVEELFTIVHRFYENLPPELKAICTLDKSNSHELKFTHGSALRVGTQGSESLRSQTYNAVLFSEFAFYDQPQRIIASVLQTCTPGAEIILETTANGLNYAQKCWVDSNSGYSKLFLHWKNDPKHNLKASPGYRDPAMDAYILTHGLSETQGYWADRYLAVKCMGDWKIFNQEMPLTANLAFVSTGGRVFSRNYPHAKLEPGHRVYGKLTPEQIKMRTFIIGVDPATGSQTGDFSAFVVLDVTDLSAIQIVAVYYKRINITEFSLECLRAAKYWNNAFAVIETNGPGPATVETFANADYDNVYYRQDHMKSGGDQIQRRLGFNTNGGTRPLLVGRLRSYVDSERIRLVDPNLQVEANTFIYDADGKEIHDKGCHDDGLFALGCALMGLDQTQHMAARSHLTRPKGIFEIEAWEAATGEDYRISDFSDDEQYHQATGVADVW